MISTVLRLEFENVFPDKESIGILNYLIDVSNDSLLEIIGFSNITPLPNYDNFFSNPRVQADITNRVNLYCNKGHINEKPIVISREGSLRLAEIILSNRNFLINNNKHTNPFKDEINLFIAYIIVNKDINSRLKKVNGEKGIENIINMYIVLSFSSSELGNFEGNNKEFAKLIYATIIRFEMLIKFLQSKEEYKYLEKSLYENFNLENSKELIFHVKYLFGKLLIMKIDKSFKFEIDEKKSENFIDSLVAEEIVEDDDFTNLKNHPIYKLEGKVYSIIDYFFVVDKFYKSIRFTLKDNYNKHFNLPPRDRGFFRFYNTEFSEKTLMKSILDEIFHHSFITKKSKNTNDDKEPDYYVRHNNRVYLFENKDVLIDKKVKVSGDILKIDKVLKERFLKSNKKAVGIGQLINSIEKIVDKTFEYDDYVNSKNNIKIYPILIVSDRIFDTIGINYKLNEWYLESIKIIMGDRYNASLIKNLTIIDIDTLIYWKPHLCKNINNFRKILDDHLKQITKKKIVNGQNYEISKKQFLKNIENQITPISNRFNSYNFPHSLLVDKFIDVINH